MYVSKDERLKLVTSKNEKLEAIDTKLALILEALKLTNTSKLVEDANEDITVEVDGETVVDTNDNDIADTVESEVSTTEENPASEIGPTYGITQMLMDAIKDEYDTIQFYNNVIATAADETGFEDVVRILKHINEEEQIHVGMIQQLLTKYDTAAAEVKTGNQEAVEIIADEELTPEDTAIEA